jgi:hypothetical protein
MFHRIATLVSLLVSTAGLLQAATPIDRSTVIDRSGAFVLVSDITAPPNAPAIEIRADDVTLDLAGHEITGGVFIEADRTNVEIRNGVIRFGAVGQKSTAGRSEIRIDGLEIVGNQPMGIVVHNAGNVEITNTEYSGNRLAVSLSARKVRLVDNVFHGGRPTVEICGLESGEITGNLMEYSLKVPAEGDPAIERLPVRGDSSVADEFRIGPACDFEIAWVVRIDGTGAVVDRNVVGGGDPATGLQVGSGSVVSRNLVIDNRGCGISIDSNTTVTQNTVWRNNSDVEGCVGAIFVLGDDNLIEGNLVVDGNEQASTSGIWVWGARNVIDHNIIEDFVWPSATNLGAGIRFTSSSSENRYLNNILRRNDVAIDDQGAGNVDGGGNVVE